MTNLEKSPMSTAGSLICLTHQLGRLYKTFRSSLHLSEQEKILQRVSQSHTEIHPNVQTGYTNKHTYARTDGSPSATHLPLALWLKYQWCCQVQSHSRRCSRHLWSSSVVKRHRCVCQLG